MYLQPSKTSERQSFERTGIEIQILRNSISQFVGVIDYLQSKFQSLGIKAKDGYCSFDSNIHWLIRHVEQLYEEVE